MITFSVLLVGMLLLGASTKKESSPEETYRHIGVFTEVLSKIKSDYVEEPDMKNVTLGALNGLLESLDPYASYLGPDQYKQYTKAMSESKADVGLILAKRFGYVAIVGSIPGSPADKAGVEAGDIITKFEGKAVEKSSDLPRMVGATKPGTRSALTVFRRGGYKELTVTIAEIEADKPVKKVSDKEEKPKISSVAGQALGLAVSDLTDAQKKELKIKGGVKVDAATDAAARAGVREGDVIVQIANVEVANAREFEAALSKLDKSKPVNVLVRRGEWAQYALIRPTR